MVSGKVIRLLDLGIEVKLVRRARLKRVNLSIRPFEGVRMSVPYRVSDREVKRILDEKAPWIMRNLEKVRALEKNTGSFDESSDFRTRDHVLKVASWKGDGIRVVVSAGKINVKYPLGPAGAQSPDVQQAIRGGIETALRAEAKLHLPARLEELSGKHGFSYNRVFFKNAKTRWGSCSEANNINLNIHLMRLPKHLCDYVVLHELCHTKEKNHGPKFWKLMGETVENAKVLDKELNRYSTRLYGESG